MIRAPLALLLLLAAAHGSGDAHAQARGPSAAQVREQGQKVTGKKGKEESVLDDAARASKLAEMEAWLRRLVGRFRIEGRIEQPMLIAGAGGRPVPVTQTGKITGIADCVGIGDGPGVHCVLNATWPMMSYTTLPLRGSVGNNVPSNGRDNLQPAMFLIGIDRNALRIQFLQVDNLSEAEGWEGDLADDIALLNYPWSRGCSRDMLLFCWFGGGEIAAKPQSDIVTMTFHLVSGKANFILTRAQQMP